VPVAIIHLKDSTLKTATYCVLDKHFSTAGT